MTLRVVVVDDHALFRRGVVAELTETAGAGDGPRVDVVGEAGNGHEAVSQYQALKPDVVLMDLVMPECDGKQALGRILAQDPAARVVILSSLGAQSDIEECLKLGARSYLQKPIDPEVMDRVLHEAVA